MSLSLGKWRRLRQATSQRGTFTILAIDHRGPLRRTLAPRFAAGDLEAALSALKVDIVRELAPGATAVLLDPETGLVPCVSSGALPGDRGLLLALDTGSTGDPAVLKTGLVPGWDVGRAVTAGAAGVKLLVYYHPDAAEAPAVEELVTTIGRACAQAEMPFYLEPLSYSLEQPGGRLPSRRRRQVVVETARRLVPLGVDVLKAEFPVDVNEESDQNIWREACEELSQACSIPWVILSGGLSYETFLRQTRIACEAGASGVMAGRAIWNEAVISEGPARRRFLRETARERIERLRCLCDALGKPVKPPYHDA